MCAFPAGSAAAVSPLASAASAAHGRAAVAAQSVSSAAAPVTAARRPAARHKRHHRVRRLPGGYKHIVVIYEENHSFDNLMGTWGKVGKQQVDGLQNATAAKTTQVAQDGTPYACLPQNDVNLATPPQPDTCQDPAHSIPASAFGNSIFLIDNYIKPGDRTCPADGTFAPATGVAKDSPGAEPGGCTRDLVHRFYQEQYQLDGGRQDRYTTGSDAVGLTQGVYDSKSTPLYRYLHRRRSPHYVVADRFFQGAFGGSFLNHQWLIAARAPIDTSHGGQGAKYSVLDSNGMPASYSHYTATGTVVDGQLTRKCADPAVDDASQACGSFAVNTVQPAVQPKGSGASIPLIDDSRYPNIGDRLSGKGISWKWYSGGWDDAVAGHPGGDFQYHHQPFNYFANYAPGQPGRVHLQDEKNFVTAARTGHLKTVSFVKPYGAENQHPGYASQANGSDHLVDLLRTITRGPQGKSTLVVVTYDEFGGQWDHVSPPRGDAFGPGTRIPALLIAKNFRRSGVDHTVYDTTSIMATLERAYKMAPVATRDAQVRGLRAAIRKGHPRRHR